MAHRGRHRCPSGCRGSRHRADGRLRAPSFRPEPVCVAVLRRVAKVDPRLRGDDGGGGVRRRVRVASDMGGGFCGNGRRRPPARCCPAPPSITPAPSNRHRPCPTPPSTMSAQKKHRHPRLRGDDGREGVWRWAKGGSDRGAGCDGAVMAGVGPAVFAPPPPPSAGHVRRRPCGFRPAFTAIGRSWQASALPFSLRPHHRRPVMSGAPLAQARPAPTTVIPAKAGIHLPLPRPGFVGDGRCMGWVDGS